MKRFYKQVAVAIHENGFGVELDGKPVKSPAGKTLVCKKENIATLLSAEWQAQEKDIRPDAMPANQLVITALDNTRPREDIVAHILDFIDTDLLCYRSPTSPYREKQAEIWGQWTAWFDDEYHADLKITDEIEPLHQTEQVRQIITDFLSRLDDLQLIIFEAINEDMSSPVLTLAFFRQAAGVEDLYQALFLDDMIRADIYHEDKYGAAPDQEKKRSSTRAQLEAAHKILNA